MMSLNTAFSKHGENFNHMRCKRQPHESKIKHTTVRLPCTVLVHVHMDIFKTCFKIIQTKKKKSIWKVAGFARPKQWIRFRNLAPSGIPRKNALGNGMSRSSGDGFGRHLLRLILQNELFSITRHVNFGLA